MHFCENIFGKSASHSRHDLPCACSIKYSLYVCTSHMYDCIARAKAREGLSPRQGRPNTANSSHRALFRKFRPFFGLMPGPWAQSFSARKIFWKLSLSESETTCPNLHSGRLSRKSLDRIARYLHFSVKIFAISVGPLRHDLP